ncbi:hypothetical protein [Actinophytocola sp. KF-1]
MGLVVLCVLAGCAAPAAPRGDREQPVEVTVLAMDADGWAPGRFAALSDGPIDLTAFASWYGRGADGADFDEVTGEAPPGSAYLAVTGNTGCRVPEGVEVSRAGDDLRFLFVGGVDRAECVRHIGAAAYLAVPAGAVEGVRTVNGEPLLDPAGPGTLVDVVPLGTGRFDPVPPAEFGTAALGALRAGVLAARPGHAAEVTEALGMPVREGERAFAFVVEGCQVDDVVLVLGPDHVTAEPVDPEVVVTCEVPEHYLTTFTVAADDVPEGATLSG